MTATLDFGLGLTEAIERAVEKAVAARGPAPSCWTPERFWSCPPTVRLSAEELASALKDARHGRSTAS